MDNNGISLGTALVITPFNGRKKTINLRYTKMNFIFTKNVTKVEQKLSKVLIPSYKCETMELVLERVKNSYRLTSINNEQYYSLNGNRCLSAYINENDQIEIGYSTLAFYTAQVYPKTYLESKLNKIGYNIIKKEVDLIINGDTGTGKSSLAKVIHEKSERKGKFVHINLSSFSANMLESEIFGHVKGSFTGASYDKVGAIELAEDGTLFLDEIDSIPMSIQLKLLLFLDSKRYRKVGALGEIKANVRLIFACGRSLEELVEHKLMRKDFYYRINCAVPIKLETLKGNPLLIERMIEELSKELKISLTINLRDRYKNYSWPGNVRQLKSHLLKKKLLSGNRELFYDQTDSLIMEEDSSFIASGEGSRQFKTLGQVKKNYCRSVFKALNENISHSSRVLGIAPNTVRAILNSP